MVWATILHVANTIFFCAHLLHTVKWYSSEIYGKLGVINRTQAVTEARRLKLLA